MNEHGFIAFLIVLSIFWIAIVAGTTYWLS
jgi:hypothetical protein